MTNLNLSDVRIFVCLTPIRMQFSFDTLMGLAQTVFDQDPLSGHLFLFFNRKRDRIKILFWDADGFCIWYKKLETEDTQIFGCTEVGRLSHNRGGGLTDAGRMVEISGQSCSRRSIMSGQGSLSVPPRCASAGVVPLDQLWAQLAPERRQQALRVLASVVARRIVSLPEKEADDERQAT